MTSWQSNARLTGRKRTDRGSRCGAAAVVWERVALLEVDLRLETAAVQGLPVPRRELEVALELQVVTLLVPVGARIGNVARRPPDRRVPLDPIPAHEGLQVLLHDEIAAAEHHHRAVLVAGPASRLDED